MSNDNLLEGRRKEGGRRGVVKTLNKRQRWDFETDEEWLEYQAADHYKEESERRWAGSSLRTGIRAAISE
jgi:hypothetical protein